MKFPHFAESKVLESQASMSIVKRCSWTLVVFSPQNKVLVPNFFTDNIKMSSFYLYLG